MMGAGKDPPPAPRRRSSRPRTKPAWLRVAGPSFLSRGCHDQGHDVRRDNSCDGAGCWETDTDTPDSGDGEGSVRRRLTSAAAFQREEEMLAKVCQVYEGYYYFR